MSPTPHGRLGVAGMALLLGILGDGLLRAGPWGVNLIVWLAVAVAGAWALWPDSAEERPSLSMLPVGAAFFFAACVAWRDSPFLRFWNVVAILALSTIPVINVLGRRFRAARLVECIGAGIAGTAAVARGLLGLAPAETPWRNRRFGTLAGSALVGLALSVPVALVFGGLLMSADPGFARLIENVVAWDIGEMVSHVALVVLFTWITAGYLRGLLADRAPDFLDRVESAVTVVRRGTMGLAEVAIPLGVLIGLFATFVGLQLTYLFGGEEVIRRTAGLTYAEYARGGFFELVFVAVLLLPVLFGAEWVVGDTASRARSVYRGMAGALLGLMGVMAASALLRMRLYTDMYGLTEDRLYATAFMLWMGSVLVSFGATILRGRRGGFAFGAGVAAFAVLAALNVLNPDATIARVNLARAGEAVPAVDTAYLGRLSADALPELSRALPSLGPAARCDVVAQTSLPRPGADGDWRTWNWGRWRAGPAIGVLREARTGCGG